MGADIGIPQDTSLAASDAQIRAWRTLSGPERVTIAMQMSTAARDTSAAGIRWRHSDYSDGEVRFALWRLTLGDDLFAKAYPDAPFLAP